MENSYDVIFIGGGPAGYVGAIKAAQLGLKVACVEKRATLGGTCLHVGCIPSKALLHATELLLHIEKEGREIGLDTGPCKIDLTKLMQHKEKIVDQLTKGIQYLFKKNKVDHIRGTASFSDPHTLLVDGSTYRAKNFVIATGSEASPLPFLPFDEERVVSSTGALALKQIPKKLLIIGAGVIGLELGSVYRRLGSSVEVIELLDRVIPEFDEELSKQFQKTLEAQGFVFNLSSKVVSAEKTKEGVVVTFQTKEGESKKVAGDILLVSIGRRPFTESLGLEKAGIQKEGRGYVVVNSSFQTSAPHIYAVGDVIGGPMLAHKGSAEAVIVAKALKGEKVAPLEMAAIPSVIYTYPEVASVGFSEKELKERKIPYTASNFPLMANSRYAAMGSKDPCFIKALAHKETGHLLGVHILAPHASELIAEPTLALSHQLQAKDLTSHVFAHPTLSESIHEAYLGLLGKHLHI